MDADDRLPLILCVFVSGVFLINKPMHQINGDIRDREVRLVDENGEQLGVFSSENALEIAEKKGLDLVKISPQSVPPVCKIMDYGKFRFEQTKRDRDVRRNQRVVEIKEIRLSPGIGTHDFDVKVGHALKFLGAGSKVKVVVRFRGREMAHTEIGNSMLERFSSACSSVAFVEKSAKLEGRQMVIFLAPKG